MNPEDQAIADLAAVTPRPLKLWVDDLKPPAIADQFGLDAVVEIIGGELVARDWVWAKTSQEADRYLFGPEPVMVLALDNDLGRASERDGRDLARKILDHVLDDPTYKPPVWMHCISFNPIAEDAIRSTFEDIKRVVLDR